MYVEVLVSVKRVEILYGHSISRHLFYVLDVALSTEDQKSASTSLSLRRSWLSGHDPEVPLLIGEASFARQWKQSWSC